MVMASLVRLHATESIARFFEITLGIKKLRRVWMVGVKILNMTKQVAPKRNNKNASLPFRIGLNQALWYRNVQRESSVLILLEITVEPYSPIVVYRPYNSLAYIHCYRYSCNATTTYLLVIIIPVIEKAVLGTITAFLLVRLAKFGACHRSCNVTVPYYTTEEMEMKDEGLLPRRCRVKSRASWCYAPR